MPTRLASDLLAWYAGNRRDLPWRRTRDPYAIWVSEGRTVAAGFSLRHSAA